VSFFDEKYPLLQVSVDKVKKKMLDELQRSHPLIREPLTQFVSGGGKYLRAGFYLLATYFGESHNDEKHITISASIEMLHIATMIHDDIIDNTVMRRKQKTIHSILGKHKGVLVGDYLLSKTFEMTVEYASHDEIKELSKTITKLCESELDQSRFIFYQSLSFRQYLKRIAGKTASLFSLSMYLGAKQSGCDEKTVLRLSKVGYFIGMSFQIIDDLLDYTGDAKVFGKPVYNDLKEGIYTIPILYALQEKPSLKVLLEKKLFITFPVKKIVSVIHTTKALQRTKDLALKYVEKAIKELELLPETAATCIIKQCTLDLVNRQY